MTNMEFLHVLFIAVIKKESMKKKIVSSLDLFMTSFLESSNGSKVHFIILTDYESEEIVR